MSTVPTKPWSEILRELEAESPPNPYLPLVRFIAKSDFAFEIHGGIFLSGLLISDRPDFEFCSHLLRVESRGDFFVFSYIRGGRGGIQNDKDKTVLGTEAVQTLDLFLKIKFGINLGQRRRRRKPPAKPT